MIDKISELRRKRQEFFLEFKTIADKETVTDEETVQLGELEKVIAEKDAQIAREQSVLKLKGNDIDDGTDSFDRPVITKETEMSGRSNMVIKHARPRDEAKGTRFSRFLLGEAISKLAKNHSAGPNLIRDMFDDKEVADALYASQTYASFDYNNFDKSMRNRRSEHDEWQKATNSTLTQATGGALVPQDFHAELIDLLYAMTVVRGSGVPVYQSPYGNTTWPRLNGSSTAYWGGEEQDTPVSNVGFDDVQTNVHKLYAMVPVSNDLIRRSPLSVPDIIRNNMTRAMALKEDQAFLWGTGSGNSDPITGIYANTLAGNKINVTSLPAGDATDLRLVNDVLSTLELALLENNIPIDGANFLFHPQIKAFLNTLTDSTGRYFFRDELDRGNLLGYPIKSSTQFPTNLAGNGVSSTATTTAASTASTTITVPTAGIAVGSYITGSGITPPVTVASITDSTHLVASSAVTVSNSTPLTFAPATAAMVGLIQWNQFFIVDTMNMQADSSTEASYVDQSATNRSTFQRDQTVFRVIKEMDLGCFHPQAAAFASVPGWTPTKYTQFNSYGPGLPYVTQTAVTTPSSAGSANPV